MKPGVGRRRMSLDEFLRFENSHPDRHEFVAGEVFAMSGGTLRHSRISKVRADPADKLDGYRRLTSLETYLIVDQRRRRVDRHWRDRDGSWQWEEYLVDGGVPIPHLDAPLTLDEIYDGVDLPGVSEPDVPEYDVEVAEVEE